jgi:hypothetical protein
MKKATKDYVYSHLSPFERSTEPGREGKANAAFFELMKRQWGDQMPDETRSNLEKVGEKFHQSFDVEKGEAKKMDTKEIILEESIAYVVENVKAGLHPRHLNTEDVHVLLAAFGKEWYKKFDYEENDIPPDYIEMGKSLDDDEEKDGENKKTSS